MELNIFIYIVSINKIVPIEYLWNSRLTCTKLEQAVKLKPYGRINLVPIRGYTCKNSYLSTIYPATKDPIIVPNEIQDCVVEYNHFLSHTRSHWNKI